MGTSDLLTTTHKYQNTFCLGKNGILLHLQPSADLGT